MSESTDQPQQEHPLLALARKWMSKFEACVRKRNYEQAKALCHEFVVWCGTEANIALGWRQTELSEWSESWPGQLAFTMDMATAKMIPAETFIVVIVAWYASGLIQGSPQRRGRATFILGLFDEDHKILCLHAHFSVNPKVVLVKA